MRALFLPRPGGAARPTNACARPRLSPVRSGSLIKFLGREDLGGDDEKLLSRPRRGAQLNSGPISVGPVSGFLLFLLAHYISIRSGPY
jgi:hypothetical protein